MDAPFAAESLILPDVLTVSQFIDRHRPAASYIQRLALGILSLSLADLKLHRPRPGKRAILNGGLGNEALVARRSRNYKDALAWVRDARSNELFSFNGVCGILGLEPNLLRNRLLELLEAGR